MERVAEGPDGGIEQARRLLRGEEVVAVPPASRAEGVALEAWPTDWANLEGSVGDSLSSGTLHRAMLDSRRLVGHLGDHVLRPWWLYIQAWATYLAARAEEAPERVNEAIGLMEQSVLAAGPTAWFGRVEASLRRLRPTAERTNVNGFGYITDRYRTEQAYIAWKQRVSRGLDSTSHTEVCDAWTELGKALGFAASRPGGAGATDSLWRGEEASYVWEVKVEHEEGAELDRRDVGQLLGQIAEEELTGRFVRGAFLTHIEKFHRDAEALAATVALLPVAIAQAIWTKVERGLDEYRRLRALGQPGDQCLPPAGWLAVLMEPPYDGPISTTDLDAAW